MRIKYSFMIFVKKYNCTSRIKKSMHALSVYQHNISADQTEPNTVELLKVPFTFSCIPEFLAD